MLFELLQGEVVRGGWSDDHVKKALDLCLSCKACKSECPTNVDIATYRAEFLAHYYESRARPLHAYAFGMVNRWLDAASIAPRVANLFMQMPILSGLIRSMLHIAPPRTLPELAPVNFRSWARREGIWTVGKRAPSPQTDKDRPASVLLWVDTFNNHIHPETSRAAVQVLRAAGCDVTIPAARLCCGRPLYDFGLLDQAKAYLQTILDELKDPIEAGTPIVVLEPSCASVFREELCNLLPADPRAQRLRNQTYLLADFLESRTPAYKPPPLPRKVLLHGHCHHRAVLKLGAEEALLRKMGADVQALDAGCCGMAGAFGFGAETYNVAMAVGERVLLPAVRKAANDTLIVSDGFSCREQIFQSTGRRGTHIAEAIAEAITTKGG